MIRQLFLLPLVLLFLIPNLYAQLGYAHPELDWFSIETEHFEVHYHDGAERSAQVVAKIAEDIYKPVTDFYDWRPDGKIHFIIKDHDDNSNGAAFYYDNKVEIWAPQMTFILRGTHNWLRNVVTHEFAHMISLGASRKITRKIPAVYFQWMQYEPERRPDVLYGYPSQMASYAIPMTIAPMWLAEGMAQFQAPDLDYDRWDTHRDMLIRTAVVNDKLHTFAEMGVFGKTSIGNERTYNAGYALTRYIAHNWGEESLKKMADGMSKKSRFTIHGTMKDVTGLNGNELHAQWKSHLEKYYETRLATITKNKVEGELVTQKGIGNIAPTWSPDGRYIAYCGSASSEYLTVTNLTVYDTQTKKTKVLKPGVNSQLTWSADGNYIIYSKNERTKHQSKFNDLFRINIKTKKEKQLTEGKRVLDPSWSADGEFIVCVTQKDGTDNVLLLDKDGTNVRQLTDFKNGEGVYSPRFSPDGKTIVFGEAKNHGRQIKIMDIESGEITDLLDGQNDVRDAIFSPDGQSIYYASDETGIFNIYSVDLNGENKTLWTNVFGGAFMPNLSQDGKLLFSMFDADGYKISKMDEPKPIDPSLAEYTNAENLAPELKNTFNESNLVAERNFDDTNLIGLKTKPYETRYGQFSFLPRVMVDSMKVKLGTYFYASDILDHVSVLGGVAANRVMDLDIFGMMEYRKLPPTLFVEFYYFTRNVQRRIEVIEDYPSKTPVDVHFRIIEGDIGGYYDVLENLRMRASFVHSRYSNKISDFYYEPQRVVFSSPPLTYFIGNHFRLQWDLNKVGGGLNRSINPTAGRKVMLRYSHELNKFFVDYFTSDDNITLKKVYTNYNVNKIELDWSEYIGMPWSKKHALTANFKGGYIDRPIDSFFNFFAGGLPGLRGYPYYAIEGRKMMIGRFTYRFPIFSNLQKQVFHLTSNKLYLSAFYEYGNAFDEDKIDFDQFKSVVGAGLRLQLFSFYGFPTALAIDAAYGLDDVAIKYDETTYNYGKEMRYYFTLLFDFID